MAFLCQEYLVKLFLLLFNGQIDHFIQPNLNSSSLVINELLQFCHKTRNMKHDIRVELTDNGLLA